ncbi:hypothetical protein [Methanorbis furvi]
MRPRPDGTTPERSRKAGRRHAITRATLLAGERSMTRERHATDAEPV